MAPYNVEVCFSPLLFENYNIKKSTVVIVDILRASSSICTAFMNGVEKIIPVESKDEARKLKEQGYTVAAERDGEILEFAHFGNSPHDFSKENVEGKTIAYSTTNGTKAINMCSISANTIIGSFLNLNAVIEGIIKEKKDVLIFCAGWKKRFNLEDALFAGAVCEKLMQNSNFTTNCDSVLASIDLWSLAKSDLYDYCLKTNWIKRLNMHEVMKDCLQLNTTAIIPIEHDGTIIKQ